MKRQTIKHSNSWTHGFDGDHAGTPVRSIGSALDSGIQTFPSQISLD